MKHTVTNLRFLGALILMLQLYPMGVFAQWSINPNINNAICTATGDQSSPEIISDGAGGAIMTWQDHRSGSNWDIYAQRVNASGAAQWNSNGVAICTIAGDQSNPAIAPDGVGGAIITWQDHRNGSNYDVYAQHVNASGLLRWLTGGVPVCTVAGDQISPTIVSDDSGGAIIAWQDYRSGTNWDIYTQRITVSGTPQWTGTGVPICTAAGDQILPTIVSDGAGGAIITWQDGREGSSQNLTYAQRVNASGVVQWTANGVVVTPTAGLHFQYDPRIVSDGSGGAIITWWDYRGIDKDIYAQHINAAGTLIWTTNGVYLTVALNDQDNPAIISDGSAGAIITWQDTRNDLNHPDIYAQSVNAAGTAQWTTNGVAICTAIGDQSSPSIVSDGAGGAIITWQDNRSGSNYDVYAQAVNSSGTVLWKTDGAPISTAADDQITPVLVSDGLGGAIVAWSDYRSGSSFDIYTQNVDHISYLGDATPHIVKVKDVPNDQGGKVTVEWNRSYLDTFSIQTITQYSIWRGISGTSAPSQAQPPGELSKLSPDKGYRTIVSQTGTTYWELVGTITSHYFPNYSFTAPTLSDSGLWGTPYYQFLVSAQTSNQFVFWDSNIDSGYSVDNLPPIAPRNAAILPLANGPIQVHWNPDRSDPDLGYYTIYRSTATGFPINNSTRLRSTSDTTVIDSSAQVGNQYFYRVTTVDIHGNESQPTPELSAAALSIQLASLTATTLTTGVQLDWSTLSEENSLGFYVERKAQNAGAYAVVSDLIPGAGTSLEEHTYQWTDTKVADGIYNYRLKLVDLNSAYVYSNAIVVTLSGVLGVNDHNSLPTVFALQQNYPNPFNPTTTIYYQIPKESYVRLAIYNVLGQEVKTLVNATEQPGDKAVHFDASNLPSGIYLYRITAGAFTDMKRMVLIK
ncbi:MAG: T9SS type A sorting domain-containing protein [Bacteroidota bacterium]